MQIQQSQLLLSATDLTNHLGCQHLTFLQQQKAAGLLQPEYFPDPWGELLRELGDRHEKAFLEHLRDSGKSVVELEEFGGQANLEKTMEAMREGIDVIAQAQLQQLPWQGRADFLLKVDKRSQLGRWSYEVADTKLSQTTRASAVLQLCLYSDLLAAVQGLMPKHMWVVKPGSKGVGAQLCEAPAGPFRQLSPDPFNSASPFDIDWLRTDDFMAYYRRARQRFEQHLKDGPSADSYPDPVAHCQLCRWWSRCDKTWRADDHLTFVAGISKLQRAELAEHDITTLESFATSQQPLPAPPQRGSLESFAKSHRQAQIQLRGRQSGQPEYEFNEVEESRGFLRLPKPSAGDLFFDIEGNTRSIGDGLEYLLGYTCIENATTASGGRGGRGSCRAEELPNRNTSDESPTNPSSNQRSRSGNTSDEPPTNPASPNSCESGYKNATLTYHRHWGLSKAEEKRAFEAFMDFVMQRWDEYPDMHIYHFAPYEPAALKRLSIRHATRENELDKLLRGERLVDLYAIVRQGIRASVESYSIKKLEPFYGYERLEELDDATTALRTIERLAELNLTHELTAQHRSTIETYNQDDCLSTAQLRNWLERLRRQLMDSGQELPRPELKDGDASEQLDQRNADVQALFDRLTADIDEQPAGAPQQARWLLAHLLDYFRRETKCAWWEYFRLQELEPDQLLNERNAIYGLRFVEELPKQGRERTPTHRYCFDPQEVSIQVGDTLHEVPGDKLGTVRAIDPIEGTVDIKKRGAASDKHPLGVMAYDYISPRLLSDAVMAFATKVAHAHESGTELKSARYDLLRKHPPRLKIASEGGVPSPSPGWGGVRGGVKRDEQTPTAAEPTALSAVKDPQAPFSPDGGEGGRRPDEGVKEIVADRSAISSVVRGANHDQDPKHRATQLAQDLNHSILAIQGPPGSGKTYIGGHMILELAKSGKRVGVTAVSHKVITNLLKSVTDHAAATDGPTVAVAQKTDDDLPPNIERLHDNPAALEAIDEGKVVGGTAWLWARADAEQKLDYLFVDEAGQMSLAMVLAAGRAAKNIVLLGDPQQLEQPQQGAHPEGSGIAALDHLLDGQQTMPPDKGLFLEKTWRLHPNICAFTSEQFYDNRLTSRPGLENQVIVADRSAIGQMVRGANHDNTPFSPVADGRSVSPRLTPETDQSSESATADSATVTSETSHTGLLYVPVPHINNQNRSIEEVQSIRQIVDKLLDGQHHWSNDKGELAPLTTNDILIVAPYNAQVSALRESLPECRVGTVDKFQGQEAAIVIYSLTSSSVEDAPRGLGFLLSPNRLNVATSRARCLVIVVGSPTLLDADCHSVDQLRRANRLCRYLEMTKR